jgi:hypothetical protein
MFFGKHLFTVDENGQLSFTPSPAIPKYLLLKDDTTDSYRVETTMLGSTKVIYEMPEVMDYFPGQYVITDIHVEYEDQSLTGIHPEKIRDRQAKTITIKMTPN